MVRGKLAPTSDRLEKILAGMQECVFDGLDLQCQQCSGQLEKCELQGHFTALHAFFSTSLVVKRPLTRQFVIQIKRLKLRIHQFLSLLHFCAFL
mmetsp:Transcript_82632/g.181701  ORF Transcript_82632/g.181701 Transcript_82632/m.181701 type:complete len:94 (-) Transcript_82632:326-607(-)